LPNSRDGSGPFDVLVLDASYRQAVAAIRSLGRAGLKVAAVASRSEAAWAPGLQSRWCRAPIIVPDLEEGADANVAAIIAALDASPARMTLPSHDGTIQALRGRRCDLERRTFLPLASEAGLDIAISKTRTLALAQQLGIAVPRSILVTSASEVGAALDEVGSPAVVKPVSSWGKREGLGLRLNSQLVVTQSEAVEAVDHIAESGFPSLIQQWLPGRRDAVTFFKTGETIWARFVQTSYREFPPLGGSSVFYESLPLLQELVAPAEQLVRAADLDGCSMVEFRRDHQNRPVLMEVNARLAGSLSLAIAAGIDFPRLLYAWAIGEPLHEVKAYRVGLRHRWIVGDLWNLKTTLESSGRPDHPSRGRALTTFFADFWRRPATWDGIHLDDLRPAWLELRHTILDPAAELASRSLRRNKPSVGGTQ
jgi:predicted ATP-grasp superfamily ATP-dependent carboligase